MINYFQGEWKIKWLNLTIFEICWKTGDITWLAYEQVAELDVLKDYFSLLRVEDVSELWEGNGDHLAEEPQVLLGHLSFEVDRYKTRIDLLPPSSSPLAPSIMFDLTKSPHILLIVAVMAPLLTRVSNQHFILPNVLAEGDLMVVIDLLCVYLEYDAHLRAGTAADRATPAGYGEFALAFNTMQSLASGTSRFTEERTHGLEITGPSPSFTNLVRDNIPAEPNNHPAPQLPEGGCWINP
ncbi:uncharacterized protein EDB91DRAFT_1251148 [Suillus paluster]|uniref:uncharacterized protein n=1 Tax=Suillus paluster TaxID=48578 RepID=UPI001B87FB70|nr:uncharacterized protein EDB91DRAFT_1251148 [Suillus paluster]KAG1734101.1 hypothetical protein EDB91DRAFT_1251148 [Suillus paluster]